MDYLQLANKAFLVFGLANRKSVAWHVGQQLHECGAQVVYLVRSEARRDSLLRWVPAESMLVCDVERPEEIERLRGQLEGRGQKFHGLVHSIAFADYRDGLKPFHETPKADFLRAVDISCYSLIALARACRAVLDDDASIVALSISTTRMASENYGFMAPVKAALDSAVVFLAKSLSRDSRIRVNAVGPGLLKTSSSAGIPGYVDAYLYAEQCTLRRAALRTEEAAAAVVMLLSPRASGINAQHLVVDAGMSVNYFDQRLITRAVGPDVPRD